MSSLEMALALAIILSAGGIAVFGAIRMLKGNACRGCAHCPQSAGCRKRLYGE